MIKVEQTVNDFLVKVKRLLQNKSLIKHLTYKYYKHPVLESTPLVALG